MNAMDRGRDNIPPHVPVKNIYRLTPAQYKELERKALTKGTFRDDSTAEHLAVIVGIEHVLRLVREGFTSE